jgi:Nucleotide modification associated domain 1
MLNTVRQYNEAIDPCREIFLKKTKDYGTAWRVLRPISIVDQIYIKAQRIRNIQELGVQKIQDDVEGEFAGIINYALIGLIQSGLTENDPEELDVETVRSYYDEYVKEARSLMEDKNHDYGEAWRHMSQESFVDLILMKLQRMRQIISNKGKTLISEGLDANYFDIINYAVFARILLEEAHTNKA